MKFKFSEKPPNNIGGFFVGATSGTTDGDPIFIGLPYKTSNIDVELNLSGWKYPALLFG
jgi:hypothetical protein